MKLLQLLPIGNVDDGLLKDLRPAIEETFRVSCKVLPVRLDPEFAFHGERQQYHSSEILQRMQSFLTADSWRMLGISGRRSLHPDSYFRFRRGADGWSLRRGLRAHIDTPEERQCQLFEGIRLCVWPGHSHSVAN